MSVNISTTVPKLAPVWQQISKPVHLRSFCTTTPSVLIDDIFSLPQLSVTFSRPTQKRLCHLNTSARDNFGLNPQAVSFICIGGFSKIFTKINYFATADKKARRHFSRNCFETTVTHRLKPSSEKGPFLSVYLFFNPCSRKIPMVQ